MGGTGRGRAQTQLSGRAATCANERESSTKGSTESLGILAETFGKRAVSTARHGVRTLWGRLFGRTRENMLPEQTSAVRASGGTGGWKPA